MVYKTTPEEKRGLARPISGSCLGERAAPLAEPKTVLKRHTMYLILHRCIHMPGEALNRSAIAALLLTVLFVMPIVALFPSAEGIPLPYHTVQDNFTVALAQGGHYYYNVTEIGRASCRERV